MSERLTGDQLDSLHRLGVVKENGSEDALVDPADLIALIAEVREVRAAQQATLTIHREADAVFDKFRLATERLGTLDTLARELAQALEGACAEIGRHYEMGPYESPWLKLRARARAAGLLDPEGG